jgi:uncharacterized protein (TIGR03790 family)
MWWSLAVAWLAVTPPALAQSGANVAVVINEASESSRLVGEYYARRHGLPAENVLRVQTSIEDELPRDAYAASIEQPLRSQLARAGLQDRVLYLVLTKGVPLRIGGTTGQQGTMASVDSELALLYRRMTGMDVPLLGPVDNPYFLGDRPLAEAARFSHRDDDIYLVSRLDGFTVPEIMALIDRGAAPEQDGRIVLDQSAGATRTLADNWLAEAARRLEALGEGDRVLLESSPEAASTPEAVLGYFSWGANDPRLRTRSVPVSFAPGAIAAAFAGADARTFAEPPANWIPMRLASARDTWFAGSPQALIGDLVRQGVTGVAGNVAEPFLQAVVRPEILFPAYLTGFNLIESFYLAMPYVGWQGVVVGDPLAAAFSRPALAAADADPPVDQGTELPAFFSPRRLLAASASGVPAGIAPLVALLACRREGQGDSRFHAWFRRLDAGKHLCRARD